jgi:hypothetical protein
MTSPIPSSSSSPSPYSSSSPSPYSSSSPSPASSPDEVPWASRKVPAQPATARSRQQVPGLPSWDPLPPGEVFVRRHARD